jgi:hypothetical protein
MERIDFRIPDYPDYSEVESAYNEYVEIWLTLYTINLNS